MMHFLYFDPGLGAMIIQGLVAIVAGIVLFSKNIWYKIILIFGLTRKKNEELFDDINIDDSDIEKKTNSDD